MTHPYTPAQLEAWAGLGPVKSQEYDGDSWWLDWSIVDQHGHSICDFHAYGEDFVPALTAAPDLARLVLEKEKEIARLRAQIKDIKECWDWWQEDTYDRCGSVVDDAIRQAMKETSDE